MASLYLLVPLGVLIVAGAVALFTWAVGAGQFDDLAEQEKRLPDDEH
jgi:cbb3-type cytochrome oxidase maturation protein